MCWKCFQKSASKQITVKRIQSPTRVIKEINKLQYRSKVSYHLSPCSSRDEMRRDSRLKRWVSRLERQESRLERIIEVDILE